LCSLRAKALLLAKTSSKMNFYIRTNYGNNVGLGHMTRILSILNYGKRKSHRFLTFVDKFENNIKDFVGKNKVRGLYEKNKKYKNQIEDAKIFLSKIKKLPRGFVIIDDYRLGYFWEKYVSNFCHKIIVIDDFINKKHYADVLINTKPSLLKVNRENYSTLKKNNKKKCKFLLGPKYSPITAKPFIKKIKSKKFNLVFYNGSSGNILIYHKIIKEILKNDNINKNICIHLVVGVLEKNQNKIEKIFSRNKNIIVHQNLKSLDKLLLNSQLLISSAGIISLESAFYNIPTILIKMSNNQEVDNISMQAIGHFFVLEKSDLLNFKKFGKLIVTLIHKYRRIKKLCSKPKIKIDAKGTKRIFTEIFNKNYNSNYLKKNKLKLKSRALNNLIVRRVFDQDINHYSNFRNLNINVINSPTNKRVSLLDHFIWWFDNTDRRSYFVQKGDLKLVILYETYKKLNNKKFVFPGLISCISKVPIIELLWSINWQKKNIDKNSSKLICVGAVPTKNYFSNIQTRYFGWKKMSKKIKEYSIVKKYLNARNCNLYVRYINYETR